MRKIKIILVLLLTSHLLFAQKKTANPYAAIDKIALQLPDSLTKTTLEIAQYVNANFNNENDKTRAIFIWLATNIEYDIDNMFAINFNEKKEDQILKPLLTRKGICANYAALFHDISNKAGIKSKVIEGYTKQNGFASYIPHAWCAAFADSTWYLYDPTWGSGYVNNGKFYKRINNEYYKAKPSVLIKSHMPFDYLWQFLEYPVTNQEFYEGNIKPNSTKTFFNYKDSIPVYENQNYVDQLNAEALRLEKNGVKNSLLFDRLHRLKALMKNEKDNTLINLYNLASADYSEAINYYNDFINYRNKQFEPKKSDPEIQRMVDLTDQKLADATNKLNRITDPDSSMANLIRQVKLSIDDTKKLVNDQKTWLKLYFSQNKSKRRMMFYERRASWFGIPLD